MQTLTEIISLLAFDGQPQPNAPRPSRTLAKVRSTFVKGNVTYSTDSLIELATQQEGATASLEKFEWFATEPEDFTALYSRDVPAAPAGPQAAKDFFDRLQNLITNGLPTAAPTAPPTPPTAAPTRLNLVDLAKSVPGLSKLVELLVKNNLTAPLSGTGPFTVFAPTNDAFAALGDLPNGTDVSAVLKYHVIAGAAILAKDLKPVQDPVTLQGKTLHIVVNNGTVTVQNATVTSADNLASNGVVHLINRVLIPPAQSSRRLLQAANATSAPTNATSAPTFAPCTNMPSVTSPFGTAPQTLNAFSVDIANRFTNMTYTPGTVTTGGATRAIVSLSRSAKEITLKDNVESMYASLTIDANTNCVTNADFYFYPAEYAIKPPIVPHPHFSPARLLPPSHTSTHMHSVRPACVPPPAPAWSGRIGCRALRPLEPRRRLRRQRMRAAKTTRQSSWVSSSAPSFSSPLLDSSSIAGGHARLLTLAPCFPIGSE